MQIIVLQAGKHSVGSRPVVLNRCVEVCCSVLQCAAVCGSVMQCDAV